MRVIFVETDVSKDSSVPSVPEQYTDFLIRHRDTCAPYYRRQRRCTGWQFPRAPTLSLRLVSILLLHFTISLLRFFQRAVPAVFPALHNTAFRNKNSKPDKTAYRWEHGYPSFPCRYKSSVLPFRDAPSTDFPFAESAAILSCLLFPATPPPWNRRPALPQCHPALSSHGIADAL